MKQPSAIELLNARILEAETVQAEAKRAFRQQMAETAESLRPSALIKNMFSGSATDPDVKAPVLDSAIGLATGFVARKVLMGSIHNPITRIAASLLQAGVSSFVAKHPEAIRNAGAKLMGIFNKFKDKKTEDDEDDA